MEDLEENNPHLYHFLCTELYLKEEFDYINYTNNEILLMDEEDLVNKKIPLSEIQGTFVGQNEDGSYTSLSMTDLDEWEDILIKYKKRNNVVYRRI